jgi:hypothetical protein
MNSGLVAMVTNFMIRKFPFFIINLKKKILSSSRRRSAAAFLLRSWVRIPPRAWMFVCFGCCVLSGRGLCDELPTRPEESYRLWRVVCGIQTSSMRSHNINPLWLIDQWDLLAGRDPITLVYKVRHPASTLAYRIFGILIADWINTKNISSRGNE